MKKIVKRKQVMFFDETNWIEEVIVILLREREWNVQ
jgi:hypothetical protein